MDAGDGVKRIGRADQPQQLAGRAGSLRALLLSRRSFSTPFRADTVQRLGKAPASTVQRVNTNFEICMESTTLHAYFERLVTTTRSATCGLAHSTTLRRQKNRCAITIFLHRLCTAYRCAITIFLHWLCRCGPASSYKSLVSAFTLS